jgi:hypothetical protein
MASVEEITSEIAALEAKLETLDADENEDEYDAADAKLSAAKKQLKKLKKQQQAEPKADQPNSAAASENPEMDILTQQEAALRTKRGTLDLDDDQDEIASITAEIKQLKEAQEKLKIKQLKEAQDKIDKAVALEKAEAAAAAEAKAKATSADAAAWKEADALTQASTARLVPIGSLARVTAEHCSVASENNACSATVVVPGSKGISPPAAPTAALAAGVLNLLVQYLRRLAEMSRKVEDAITGDNSRSGGPIAPPLLFIRYNTPPRKLYTC